MSTPLLVVVDCPERWPLESSCATILSSRAYLCSREYASLRGVKVFNLCRSYKYQSMGYYVSLLAEARGHRPQPSISTILQVKSRGLLRQLPEDVDRLIQSSLHPVQADAFTLSVYFGRNLAKRYDRLAKRLFNLFPVPLLRAQFARRHGEWELRSLSPISASEIPESHHPFVLSVMEAYFSRRRWENGRLKSNVRFDMAILVDPEEADPPSNEEALRLFERCANRVGIATTRMTRDDFARLAEYDALFIRTTTQVNHYTYRFASMAAHLGLVVIDDPDSIVRCSNKVYLSEQMSLRNIAVPRSLIVHASDSQTIEDRIGLPCILKQPDSAFSKGVVKVSTREELHRELKRLFQTSDLLVAQEFLPTAFDWRVTILDHTPLFACRYFMAPDHWQIIRQDATGEDRYGEFETVAVEDAPAAVIRTAVKAARCIGGGLYGVDLKVVGGKVYLIEINDNPNIDHGVEDVILGERLYDAIVESVLRRLEKKRDGKI